MRWKLTAYWVGVPTAAALCTFLVSILHVLRSGQHLTDIQIRFMDTPAEIADGAVISFRSQNGGVKQAEFNSDSLCFVGEQLGAIKTIDCTLRGSLKQLLPAGSVIEIRQIPRRDQKFEPRLLFRRQTAELRWASGSQSAAEFHSTLAKADAAVESATGIMRSLAALNSEGFGSVFRKTIRNVLLALAGTTAVLLSIADRRFIQTASPEKIEECFSGAFKSKVSAATLSAEQNWAWIVLAAGLTALIVWRDPRVFLSPSMTWEDGMFYCYFLHNKTMSSVAHFNNGYIPLAPNVISLAATFAPVRSVPYLYAILGLLLALAQHLMFFHKSFRSVNASDASRFFGCVAMGCIPFASAHQVSNVAYAIWQQLFLLILLGAVGFRFSSFTGNAFLWLMMFLGVWSNPLSIVLVGTIALRCISKGQIDRFWISLAATAFFYQLLGVESGAQSLELRTLSSVCGAVLVSVQHMLDSFSLGVSGQDLQSWLKYRHLSLIPAVGSGFAVLGLFYVKSRPADVWFWPIVLTSCLALSAGSYIGRGGMILDVRDAPRYAYVSASFSALIMGMTYFRVFQIAVYCACSRISERLRVLVGVSFGISLIFVYNVRTTTYDADRENGLVVRNFFEQLDLVLRLPAAEVRNVALEYPKKNGEPPLVATFNSDGLLMSTVD